MIYCFCLQQTQTVICNCQRHDIHLTAVIHRILHCGFPMADIWVRSADWFWLQCNWEFWKGRAFVRLVYLKTPEINNISCIAWEKRTGAKIEKNHPASSPLGEHQSITYCCWKRAVDVLRPSSRSVPSLQPSIATRREINLSSAEAQMQKT